MEDVTGCDRASLGSRECVGHADGLEVRSGRDVADRDNDDGERQGTLGEPVGVNGLGKDDIVGALGDVSRRNSFDKRRQEDVAGSSRVNKIGDGELRKRNQ